MKRKVFATAVVLLTITTPLFAGQEAAAKQPATGSEKQQPAAAAKQQPAPAAAKQAPAPAAAKPQPVPASAKQAPAPAAAKQQPAAASADKKATPQTAPAASVAAAKPGEPAKQAAGKSAAPAGKSTGKPPAPPKTPSVKLNPVVTATSKPLPNKAVAASAGNAPVPTAAAKASVTSLSALQLKVQSSKTLITALQPKLAGVDVVSAAEGFKDLQQFVSAVHASHNLGLRFDTLKTKLVTGKPANLRQAIQELRPAASAAIESQRAQYDADGDYPCRRARGHRGSIRGPGEAQARDRGQTEAAVTATAVARELSRCRRAFYAGDSSARASLPLVAITAGASIGFSVWQPVAHPPRP